MVRVAAGGLDGNCVWIVFVVIVGLHGGDLEMLDYVCSHVWIVSYHRDKILADADWPYIRHLHAFPFFFLVALL